MQVVWDDAANTIGNPCPVVDRDTGTIWLPFTRNNDRIFVTKSTDDGETWTVGTRMGVGPWGRERDAAEGLGESGGAEPGSGGTEAVADLLAHALGVHAAFAERGAPGACPRRADGYQSDQRCR
jgi:hypothetical protein